MLRLSIRSINIAQKKKLFFVSFLEYFRHTRWLDIYPEYDPHKYNSFPMNVGLQSYKLTNTVKDRSGAWHKLLLKRAMNEGSGKYAVSVLTLHWGGQLVPTALIQSVGPAVCGSLPYSSMTVFAPCAK